MALGAATLHASWNFAVKRNTDSGLALWGQFFIAMFVAAGALVAWWIIDERPDFAVVCYPHQRPRARFDHANNRHGQGARQYV